MSSSTKWRKQTMRFWFFLLFSLCAVGVYYLLSLQTNTIHAQESNSLSPTPSVFPSSSTPTIPDINPETLRDPAAFKLDQQIKGTTRDFFKSVERNEPLNNLENKASQRKHLMKQAIKKYSYVFLGNALTSSQTSSLDEQLQQYFEKPIALSAAELGVMHIDDFENHTNSRFDYSLRNIQEPKQFNFYPAGDFGGHISGTILNVNGVVLDDDLSARVLAAPNGGGENNNDPVPTNVEILKEASPDGLGAQKTAVIFIYSKGIDTIKLPPKEEIFSDILTGEVQKFFKEASYGKMWLDEINSHMYGWYEIEKKIGPCSLFDHLDEVLRTVGSHIDLTQYDRLMFGVYPFYSACAFVGKISLEDQQTGSFRGSVGAFGTFDIDKPLFPGDKFFTDFAFAHEMGHGLGVAHANAWRCDQGGLEGNCEHIEGGNIYDLMGGGGLNHFNGYFKHVFQWLNKPVINITSSGKYTLHPLENPESIIAKISRPDVRGFPTFYLEARLLAFGFDDPSSAQGIHINWINEPLETRLLSLNPPSDETGVYWLPPEPLRQGQSFHDKPAGLTITNIDDTTVDIQLGQPKEPECRNDSLDVKVKEINAFEPFERDKTTIEWVKSPTSLVCTLFECTLKRNKKTDKLIIFWLTIENNNDYACPDVRVKTWDYQSWIKQPEKVSYSSSKKTVNDFVMFDIPAFTPSGKYDANIRVENADTGQMIFSTAREIQIIDEFLSLEGDLNNDGKVDIFDLVTVAKDFGKKGEGFDGDADKNGVVDIFDLVLVARNFGKKIE